MCDSIFDNMLLIINAKHKCKTQLQSSKSSDHVSMKCPRLRKKLFVKD